VGNLLLDEGIAIWDKEGTRKMQGLTGRKLRNYEGKGYIIELDELVKNQNEQWKKQLQEIQKKISSGNMMGGITL